MAIAIVTHPHSFDKDITRKDLIRFLKTSKMPIYFIRDGKKDAYGEALYNGESEASNKLGKYGRASLRD